VLLTAFLPIDSVPVNALVHERLAWAPLLRLTSFLWTHALCFESASDIERAIISMHHDAMRPLASGNLRRGRNRCQQRRKNP